MPNGAMRILKNPDSASPPPGREIFWPAGKPHVFTQKYVSEMLTSNNYNDVAPRRKSLHFAATICCYAFAMII